MRTRITTVALVVLIGVGLVAVLLSAQGPCTVLLTQLGIRNSGMAARARVDLTADVVSSGLHGALDLYRAHIAHYPGQLADLQRRPAAPNDAQHWAGPYLRPGTAMLSDAWGRPLRYRFPGQFNVGQYDLWSVGPDGLNGTADDITNWSTTVTPTAPTTKPAPAPGATGGSATP